MNCSNCGTSMPADAEFCPNCGQSVKAKATKRPVGGTYSGLGTIAPMRESRASVLEPGTRFAERYEVIRKLGEGGMGVVYVARDTNTGEEMVLKLIHPDLVTGEEAVKRLMAEGLMARQIRHPNIVAVYDVSQYNGQPYFTMEFVKGGTLRSWLVNGISAGREVSLQTAGGLMKSMLAGLSEAHRMGVVHRDLKPENVLLVGDPDAGDYNLKILDFGIAKAIGAAPATRSGGGPIGTPIYMAPEQMTSADAVGPQADIYSVSVMLYELLMDAPPQGRWDAVSKNRRDVPPSIDALLEKGLSARPRSRQSSATEFAKELEVALGGRPQPVIIPDPGPKPDPGPRPPQPEKEPWYKYQGMLAGASKRTKMILGGVGVLLVLGAIGNMMDQPVDLPPEFPPDTTGQTPPPPPPEFNAAGYWMDGFGNRFNVTHDGTNFTATSTIPGFGVVTLTGTLTTAGAQFTLRTQAGLVMRGTGEVYPDGGGLPHLRYSLADGTTGDFKINHVN